VTHYTFGVDGKGQRGGLPGGKAKDKRADSPEEPTLPIASSSNHPEVYRNPVQAC